MSQTKTRADEVRKRQLFLTKYGRLAKEDIFNQTLNNCNEDLSSWIVSAKTTSHKHYNFSVYLSVEVKIALGQLSETISFIQT